VIHLPHLITDLGLLLLIAAVVSFVFKFIKQPVVLGYIVAGFLVSPYFSFIPNITDSDTIKIWAELGVIFLLFSLGLEFSFKKLKQVGAPASITGFFELSLMLIAGYSTGKLLGWEEMDCLFLGGIISISSTTIIIRAFDELGVKSKHFASLVFGILIIEDLAAVLLMVLLSTIAVSREFEGTQLLMSSMKLIFFLSIWFLGGIFLVPTILRHLKRHLSDELLLITSLGLCLGMVILATQAGFSAALGAFVMGSILAETPDVKRIEHLILPMKDFFGAIFFISVGMLINPQVLVQHWSSALIISLVLVCGKIIFITMGSLISGQTLRNSVRTGFSLAQIGEFSFIIATLGLTLKVTSEFLYPLAVCVSVITTFLTPYLIRFSAGIAEGLEKKLPARLTAMIGRYASSTEAVSISSESREALKGYLTKMGLTTIVLVGITFFAKQFSLQYLGQYFQSSKVISSAAFICTFILSAPFFWSMILGREIHLLIQKENYLSKLLLFVRFCVAAAIMIWQIIIFLPAIYVIVVLIILMLVGYFFFPSHLANIYQAMEAVFVKNITSTHEPRPSLLLPWEAHLASYTIPPEANYLGKSLESLRIRERFGVTVVLIERGSLRTKAPSRNQVLYPGDKVSVIGTDDQLSSFKNFIEKKATEDPEFQVSDYGLKACILTEGSVFIGRTIRDSGIREETEGLVVGLERKGKRLLNPDSGLVLQLEDVLWIVGNKDKLKDLK
jgi:CPA2 family monovalent cation:H+ antiporter-2